MRSKFLILFFLSVFIAFCSSAQRGSGYTQSRILFLLDESSSMLQTWTGAGGSPKYKIANEIVMRLMDSVYAVNPRVEFSLRVFGNQYTVPEHNCMDTKSEVPFSPDNRTQMGFRLDDMHPLGVTAIAYSLSQAAENDLVDEDHNAYSIVLITDGGESCGGDICGVMQKLIKNKVLFKPYILSLEDVPELKNEYECMGDYLSVVKRSDIPKAVATIVQAFKPILKISPEDYQKLQIIAANSPSILKVNIPQLKIDQQPVDTITQASKPVVKGKPVAPTKPGITPKPVVKAADTLVVAPKPQPKPSSITVGEEKPRSAPTPVKMAKLNYTPVSRMFTAPAKKYKPVGIAIGIPEMKPIEAEVPLVIHQPLKMKALQVTSVIWRTNKGVLPKTEKLNIEIPEIKPFMEATVPATMVRVSPTAVKKQKIAKVQLRVPEKLAITIPEEKPVPVAPVAATMAKIAPTVIKKQKVAKNPLITLERIAVTAPVQKAIEVEPVRPAFFKVASIGVTGMKQFNTNAPQPPKVKKLKVVPPAVKPIEPDVVKVDTVVLPAPLPTPVVVKRKKDEFARLKPSKFRMHLLYVNSFMDSEIKPLKITPPTLYKPPVAPAVLPSKPTATTPKPAPKPVAKTGALWVGHEDAKETTLEIYLTNGKGKFYTTTPRVILLDPSTNKELKNFFRMVDASGNPDPITNLPAGQYDLTLAGRDDLLAHVDIQLNKKNKVYIKVKDYSLFFYYENAPNRPVKEFAAEVTQLVSIGNGKTVTQKCTETLEYEPGNYHITINTFPKDVRNTDLDDNTARGIKIPQPGFVKFVSEVNTNSVALFKPLGDRFVQFATLRLNDPASQHLQIQPGQYQVRYNNGETQYGVSERVITFDVKSLEEKIITLVK